MKELIEKTEVVKVVHDGFIGAKITVSDPRTGDRYLATITAVRWGDAFKVKVGGPWFEPTMEEFSSIVDSRVGRCCE